MKDKLNNLLKNTKNIVNELEDLISNLDNSVNEVDKTLFKVFISIAKHAHYRYNVNLFLQDFESIMSDLAQKVKSHKITQERANDRLEIALQRKLNSEIRYKKTNT